MQAGSVVQVARGANYGCRWLGRRVPRRSKGVGRRGRGGGVWFVGAYVANIRCIDMQAGDARRLDASWRLRAAGGVAVAHGAAASCTECGAAEAGEDSTTTARIEAAIRCDGGRWWHGGCGGRNAGGEWGMQQRLGPPSTSNSKVTTPGNLSSDLPSRPPAGPPEARRGLTIPCARRPTQAPPGAAA